MGIAPDTIPEGWTEATDRITKTEHYGLFVVCSVDKVTDGSLPSGEYTHMSISRPHQTPGWKECSRYVWESGLFNNERPIVMILWPPNEAKLGFANVFHFWQRVE